LIGNGQKRLYFSIIKDLMESRGVNDEVRGLILTLDDDVQFEINIPSLIADMPQEEAKLQLHLTLKQLCPHYPKDGEGAVSLNELSAKDMNIYIDWLFLCAAESGIIVRRYEQIQQGA
jgi:hypothetical protein